MDYKIQPWKHQLAAIEIAKDLPHFALFFEQGCLAAHTKIKVNRGGASKVHTIEELFRKFNHVELTPREPGFDHSLPTYVRSWKGDVIGLHPIIKVLRAGEKEVLQVNLGRYVHITLTPDHELLTKRGWVRADGLTVDDFVAYDALRKHLKTSKPNKPKTKYITKNVGTFHPYAREVLTKAGTLTKGIELHRLVYEAKINGLELNDFLAKLHGPNRLRFIDPAEHHIHHKDHDAKNNHPDNLECLSVRDHIKLHSPGYSNFRHGSLSWQRVRSVIPAGIQMTYDIVCHEPHRNFVANDIVVHNCGKSPTLVNLLREKYAQHQQVLPTLIVCPQIVIDNWQRELLAHSHIDASQILMLRGSAYERMSDFDQQVTRLKTAKIVVTNYEGLLMNKLFEKLYAWGPRVVVLDESQKIKSLTSRRTKLCIKLGQQAMYRYILSGTPIVNSPFDIFSQFLFLDNGETFTDNYRTFRSRYFVDHNAGRPAQSYFPDWRPRMNCMKEINERIYKKAMRVEKKDCLDLPPLIRQQVAIELRDEQQRVYDELRDDSIAEVAGGVVSADMALKRALRLQQVTTGFVKMDDESIQEFKPNPRCLALKELLDQIGPTHKVLIWAVFKQNYKDIAAVLTDMGINYVEVHGGVSEKDKSAAVDAFNDASSGVRVLIGHPASCGVGVNLARASYAIFYSRDFSLENDLQAEARNYRGGSEIHEKVTRIDIVAKDTIDEVVLEALSNKQMISDAIINYMGVSQ